jgi:UTP-glucose-1-phosphate uridylyltransferase
MATRSDFTDDEWEAMQKGVTGAGMLVSVSDQDFTDMFGEASALAKALRAQHEQGASDLVRELAKARGTGFGLTTSRQEVEAETFEALRSATETLAAKAPEETENYRQLVLGVADAVAAAKSGVEESETAALDKIKEALRAG